MPLKYYWAYGSNMNIAHMRRRCPHAIRVRPMTLNGGALVFRGVADVTAREGSKIHGALWKITKKDEEELDRYEGVASGLYLKRYFLMEVKNQGIHKVLYYQMAIKRGIDPPNDDYIERIAEGYRQWGFDLAALDRALQASWKEKELNDFLRARREKRGGTRAREIKPAAIKSNGVRTIDFRRRTWERSRI